MDQLSFYRALDVNPPAILSFTGAGGKTTIILRLMAEMNSAGLKTLFTTTTKFYPPPGIKLFLTCEPKSAVTLLKKHFLNDQTAVLGKRILPDGKIEGIEPGVITFLLRELGVSVLVEADGAKGLPIKGYATHEPVVPPDTNIIIAVIGADALKANLDQKIAHRPNLLSAQINIAEGTLLTEKALADAFKNILRRSLTQAPLAKTVSVLNKADLLDETASAALAIAAHLSADPRGVPESLLFLEGQQSAPVKVALTRHDNTLSAAVSCVLLAAGSSSRMGVDKLTLDYHGKTIIEHSLNNILSAGIEDIVIVTRPNSGLVKLLKDGKIRIIENKQYKSGLASSLITGLKEIDGRAQGVIFALADQPLVTPDIYRKLTGAYQKSLKLVVGPSYKGQRGNPTLFDRRTWSSIMDLSGDEGGRRIIEKLSPAEISLIETDLDGVLFDVDTPEAYQKLLNEH
jgi:molybdenum cofactor cytidylyltransferase